MNLRDELEPFANNGYEAYGFVDRLFLEIITALKRDKRFSTVPLSKSICFSPMCARLPRSGCSTNWSAASTSTMWILSPGPKMFDAKICCGSWAEADAITAQARAANFRVEIRADEIVDGKPHVFLKVWCAGNVDRIAEIEMILYS